MVNPCHSNIGAYSQFQKIPITKVRSEFYYGTLAKYTFYYSILSMAFQSVIPGIIIMADQGKLIRITCNLKFFAVLLWLFLFVINYNIMNGPNAVLITIFCW